jgi:hypothetical protein
MGMGIRNRILSIAVAVFVVGCFSALPAQAMISKGCNNGKCYASKKVKKKKVVKRQVRQVRYAKANTYRGKSIYETKWHGWVARSEPVFFHEGTGYRGGTPHGPRMWYNNYEGGFNSAVFWKLYDRNMH